MERAFQMSRKSRIPRNHLYIPISKLAYVNFWQLNQDDKLSTKYIFLDDISPLPTDEETMAIFDWASRD